MTVTFLSGGYSLSVTVNSVCSSAGAAAAPPAASLDHYHVLPIRGELRGHDTAGRAGADDAHVIGFWRTNNLRHPVASTPYSLV